MARPTLDEVTAAIEEDNYSGFCTVCGEQQGGCEPDARKCKCESCGARAVFGAEECLIAGLYDDESPAVNQEHLRSHFAVVHVGGAVAVKSKKPRAIPVWQLIRGKMQSDRFKPLAIAMHEKYGIVTDGSTMIIDVGQSNTEAIVSDDIAERVEMWSAKCRDLLNQNADRLVVIGELLPGTGDNSDKTYRRLLYNDVPATESACIVNEVFRITAERHGKVTAWRYVPAGGHSCVIGFDRTGKRRAVIACVYS